MMKNDEIKKLFWPILIEQLFITIMGNVDTVILSGFSDGAVAASGIANQLLVLGFMFLNIISVGSTIVLTQVMGQNNKKNIKKVEINSILLSSLFPLLLTLIFLLFGKQMLLLIKTPQDIIHLAIIFLTIVSISIIPQSISGVISAIFRSHGNSKITLYVTLLTNLINIMGAILVVYTDFNILGKGVLGVAYVTLISRIIGTLVLSILYLRYYKNRDRQNHEYISKISSIIDFKIFKRILSLGIPSGLESIFYNFSQTIMASIIAILGTNLISARIYTLTITSLVFSVTMGISMTSQLVVGHLIGEGNKKRAKKFINKTSFYGFFLIIILSLFISYFSPYLIKIFTNNGVIVNIVPKLCLLSIFLEPFRFLNCNYIAGLSSGGDVKYPVILGIIVIYIINIPLSYLSVMKLSLGLYGIFYCSIIDEAIRSFLLHRRWNSSSWENINILKDL